MATYITHRWRGDLFSSGGLMQLLLLLAIWRVWSLLHPLNELGRETHTEHSIATLTRSLPTMIDDKKHPCRHRTNANHVSEL